MQIYNSQTRKKEEFVPLHPGKVGIYACGPTVYNYFHVGNARPFLCRPWATCGFSIASITCLPNNRRAFSAGRPRAPVSQ